MDETIFPTVPHHGGTPPEMLRDLADFLDKLDNLGEKLIIKAPGNRLDGKSLDNILNPGEDKRTMQSDLRWLAELLENGSSDD